MRPSSFEMYIIEIRNSMSDFTPTALYELLMDLPVVEGTWRWRLSRVPHQTEAVINIEGERSLVEIKPLSENILPSWRTYESLVRILC